jgi:hypothetical protein
VVDGTMAKAALDLPIRAFRAHGMRALALARRRADRVLNTFLLGKE